MGAHQSAQHSQTTPPGVNFQDFQVIRAIGKGSFGKVCIAQKKDNKRMFAMKYMNKKKCILKDAYRNVLKEIEILANINHPFVVNLWFTFQDEEDIFIVTDLFLGGDLRYHLNHDGRFSEDRAKLYIIEMALAIDYLNKERIIHRDVKPENMLLDDSGHAHLTDFNVATKLDHECLATSMSGTRPYMAPEVYQTTCGDLSGYSFEVDWWSLGTLGCGKSSVKSTSEIVANLKPEVEFLNEVEVGFNFDFPQPTYVVAYKIQNTTGVCFYEMLRGRRPYELSSQTHPLDARNILISSSLAIPVDWPNDLIAFLGCLLKVDPAERIHDIKTMKHHSYMERIVFEDVLRCRTAPIFIPAQDSLNCDPSFELEEMLIESKPLHKKKKRLHKRSISNRELTAQLPIEGMNRRDSEACTAMMMQFKLYNREELLKNEEERIKKLEEELGLRISPSQDAIGKILGRVSESEEKEK